MKNIMLSLRTNTRKDDFYVSLGGPVQQEIWIMLAKKGIYLFAGIGLFLGFLLERLANNEIQAVVFYVMPAIFSLLFCLAYDGKHTSKLCISSLITSIFLTIPLVSFRFGFEPEYVNHHICFLIAYPVFVYTVHSFHYAYHQKNTIKISYSSLFAAVWNTIPLLFIASIFLGVCQILFVFGAYVFQTVGNNYLWELYFGSYNFRLITNTTIFFIGIYIGNQNTQIIYSLRLILLRIMYYIFPVFAIISLLYLGLYIYYLSTISMPFSNNLHVIVPLSILGIIFFNAYFQDGEIDNWQKLWLKALLKIYRITLFILVTMMGYHIFRDFSFDINILVYLLSAVFLGFTYFISVFFSENKEKSWIKLGNVSTAMFFIFSLFLLNIPYYPVAFKIGTGGLVLN